MVLKESNGYLQQDYQNIGGGHNHHLYGNTGANNNQQYQSPGGNQHINKQLVFNPPQQFGGQSHSQPQQPQFVKV